MENDLIFHIMMNNCRDSGYNLHRAMMDDTVNLHRLISGSEGTLAVIGEVTLRLVRFFWDHLYRAPREVLYANDLSEVRGVLQAAETALLAVVVACLATIVVVAIRRRDHWLDHPDVGRRILASLDDAHVDASSRRGQEGRVADRH